MGRTPLSRGAVLLGLLGCMAVPDMAEAVVPGANGKVLFTSGRAPAGSDAAAQLWTVNNPGETPTILTDIAIFPQQHRHSSWAPDNKKVVYAYGPNMAWDLELKDLEGGSTLNISFLDGGFQDRPSISPDGTRIAYESTQVGAIRHIFVKTMANPGAPALQLTSGADEDIKPSWSADSQFIYYSHDVDPAAPIDHDIFRKDADSPAATPDPIVTGATDDYQVAVSADGQNLCFTRNPFGSPMAKIVTSTATGAGQTDLANTGQGDYNCTWSPDGKKIAYVNGVFGNGALVMKNSDGTGLVQEVVNNVIGRFDGNPDWAVDPPPTCTNTGPTSIPNNGSATIQLTCTDPENQTLTYSIVTQPTKGTLSNLDATNGTVTYTANPGQSGPDSFTFKANDGKSDSNTATASVSIAEAPANNNNGGGGGGDVTGTTAGTNTTTTGPGGDGPGATAAAIGRVVVSPKRFRRARVLPVVSAAAAVGTTISFSLDKNATARLTFGKVTKGRRVGRRCVARTPRNATRRACVRVKNVRGAIAVDGVAGTNKVRFGGAISRTSRLGLGTFRVTVNATDTAGNRSTPKSASFRIVRR